LHFLHACFRQWCDALKQNVPPAPPPAAVRFRVEVYCISRRAATQFMQKWNHIMRHYAPAEEGRIVADSDRIAIFDHHSGVPFVVEAGTSSLTSPAGLVTAVLPQLVLVDNIEFFKPEERAQRLADVMMYGVPLLATMGVVTENQWRCAAALAPEVFGAEQSWGGWPNRQREPLGSGEDSLNRVAHCTLQQFLLAVSTNEFFF
jgi:hypothetical protein